MERKDLVAGLRALPVHEQERVLLTFLGILTEALNHATEPQRDSAVGKLWAMFEQVKQSQGTMIERLATMEPAECDKLEAKTVRIFARARALRTKSDRQAARVWRKIQRA